MILLLAVTFFILLGLYYLTGLDFEIGSGISEQKRKAKDADFKETQSNETQKRISEGTEEQMNKEPEESTQ